MKKKKTSPLIYIIVLNWNRKDDTKECLDSLQFLTYSNYKVVVVDNGSTDNSVEYLKKYFLSVKFIQNSSNLGFALGNNIGIKYALQEKADYILILNNDTIVSATFLEKLINVMTKDSTIAIAGPKILYHYRRNRIWFAGGKIYFWLGNTWHIGNKRKDSLNFQKIVEEDYQTGCALFIRAKVINKIGMFDSRYTAYFEDADLCIRAKKMGFRVVCVQYARIWHKISATTGGGLNPKKAYLKAESGVKFFRKNSPRLAYYSTAFVCAVCYIILASIMEGLKGHQGVFKAFIKGLIKGIKDR